MNNSLAVIEPHWTDLHQPYALLCTLTKLSYHFVPCCECLSYLVVRKLFVQRHNAAFPLVLL